MKLKYLGSGRAFLRSDPSFDATKSITKSDQNPVSAWWYGEGTERKKRGPSPMEKCLSLT